MISFLINSIGVITLIGIDYHILFMALTNLAHFSRSKVLFFVIADICKMHLKETNIKK